MADNITTPDVAVLRERLTPFGQEHVLQYWEQLDPAGQAALAAQIDKIDLELLGELFRGASESHDWAALARQAEPPQAVRLSERTADVKSALGFTSHEARERGVEALRAGEVGVLLVAGGQGTRLGFELPKSCYPIGELSKATLLQIHIEKVRAISRRYGVAVPLYLMTSPATHEATVQFLHENDRFGLAEQDLLVFCQGTMPAVDAKSGKLLLADFGRLFESPDGHGGTVAALEASGAISQMQQRGIGHLFYFQVDNPLVPICDPELVGSHLLADSELTSLAVAKSDPQDKLGNFAMIDGRLHVIEYSDFPDDVAEQRDDGGGLRFWAGSVAIHVFSVDFLRRSLTLKDALPFHIAHKKVPHVDTDGQKTSPTEPNALKFERFIFDLLPQAVRPIVVEYAEGESFAPLKNAPGAPKDTAEYVQRMMADQSRRWLEAAGAEVADGVVVEMSPLWALDAEDVPSRVTEGAVYDKSVYLTDE